MEAAFRHQSRDAGRTRGGAASLEDRTLPAGSRSRYAALMRPPVPMTRQPEGGVGRPPWQTPVTCRTAAGLRLAPAVNCPSQRCQLTVPPPWRPQPSSAGARAANMKSIRTALPAATATGAGSDAPRRVLRFWAVPARFGNLDGSRCRHLSHEPFPILLRSGRRDLLISALPPRKTTVWRTRTFMPAEGSYVTRCPGGRARAVPGLILTCVDAPEPGMTMTGAGTKHSTTALSGPLNWCLPPHAGDGRK
jgi:hypothetical protein